MEYWRAVLLAVGYGTVLLTVHLVFTKGTWVLPDAVKVAIGSDAGSTLTRPWALLTSQFFHNDRFHILYNLVVMLATLPFAIKAQGPWTLLAIVASSAIAALLVNVVMILPLSNSWTYAAEPLHGRLVGASVAIFAGAGMAWLAWSGPVWAKGVALGAFIVYEAVLAVTGSTSAFVGIYHVAGAFVGIGMGAGLRLIQTGG